MREIKFRGKRIDTNEFVYGNLLTAPDEVFFIQEKDWRNNPIPIHDETTIGQYIGLEDKNGREIYEGDIVKLDHRGVYEVVFEHGSFCFNRCGCYSFYDGEFGCLEREIEAIGNIYDNPELLEV